MRLSALIPSLVWTVGVFVVGCSSSTTDAPATTDSGATADVTADTSTGDVGDTRLDDTRIDDTRLDVPPDAATDGASCTLHKKYSSKNAACNACAQDHCCTAINGCFDDPRCDDDYVNCILVCALAPDDAGPDAGDATGACLADCDAKHPEGKAEYDAAIGCAETACVAECK